MKLIKLEDLGENRETKTMKYLYIGIDPIVNVVCTEPAVIIELSKTRDYLLVNELFDTSDIKHLWGSVHGVMDRALANSCDGIILPPNAPRHVYFIFGVVHSESPSIPIFILQRDTTDHTSLVRLS